MATFIQSNEADFGTLDFKHEWLFADPGPSASQDNPVVQRLAQSITDCVGAEAVHYVQKPHASSARITTKEIGAPGIVWSPNGGIGPHASNEAVLIDSIPVGAKILLDFLGKTSAAQPAPAPA